MATSSFHSLFSGVFVVRVHVERCLQLESAKTHRLSQFDDMNSVQTATTKIIEHADLCSVLQMRPLTCA